MHAKAIVFALLSVALLFGNADGWGWARKVWHGVKRAWYGAKRIWKRHAWVRKIVHVGLTHAVRYGLAAVGDVKELREMPDEVFRDNMDKLALELSKDLSEKQVDEVVDGLTEMRNLSEDEFAKLEIMINDMEEGEELPESDGVRLLDILKLAFRNQ
ncbi:uncharacterized protein LOC120345002 [Styela clava]